jgi:hypothetical protein
MKALIAARGKRHPFVHDLNQLEIALNQLNEVLPPTPYAILDLTPFAISTRYVTGDVLTEEEKSAMRRAVAIVREHILERILSIEQTGTP